MLYLNNEKTTWGYSNELTKILSFLTGKNITYKINTSGKNDLIITGTNEQVGMVSISKINDRVNSIMLTPKYVEFLPDVAFLVGAKSVFMESLIVHKKDKDRPITYEEQSLLNSFEKLGGFLIMTDEDYNHLLKIKSLEKTLYHREAHGVLIPQKGNVQLCYDYCTQKAYYDEIVDVTEDVIKLTAVGTKPVGKYVKKFSLNQPLLCVNDIAYIENVGNVFIPGTSKNLIYADKVTTKADNKLKSMSIFGEVI